MNAACGRSRQQGYSGLRSRTLKEERFTRRLTMSQRILIPAAGLCVLLGPLPGWAGTPPPVGQLPPGLPASPYPQLPIAVPASPATIQAPTADPWVAERARSAGASSAAVLPGSLLNRSPLPAAGVP